MHPPASSLRRSHRLRVSASASSGGSPEAPIRHPHIAEARREGEGLVAVGRDGERHRPDRRGDRLDGGREGQEPLGGAPRLLAERGVIARRVAGADSHLEPAGRDRVDGERLTGEQRRMTQDDVRDERSDPDRLGGGCEAGERGPDLEPRALSGRAGRPGGRRSKPRRSRRPRPRARARAAAATGGSAAAGRRASRAAAGLGHGKPPARATIPGGSIPSSPAIQRAPAIERSRS